MKRARMMLVTSMVIFGTIGLFKRFVPVTSGELALYRAVLATVTLGAYLLLTKQALPLGKIRKALPLLILSGIAMGFNWILLFEAYKYTTVAISTLSYYFAPVIVTAVCPFLFKEKLTGKQLICFIMSTLGLSLIIGITDLGRGGNDIVGIAFGLGAAVFYATVILLNKFIKGVAGIQRTFLQFLAAIAILFPYVLCTGGETAYIPGISEAGQMGKWLLKNGLEEHRLILETKSMSTTANAQNSLRILRQAYPQVSSVALVTSDYHVPRGCVLFNSKFILSTKFKT